MRMLPTARDFAWLLDGDLEANVTSPKEVADRLRQIIDLLDRGDKPPYARLKEAYSIEGTRQHQFTEVTLILTFERLSEPEEYYRNLEEEREARKKEREKEMNRDTKRG